MEVSWSGYVLLPYNRKQFINMHKGGFQCYDKYMLESLELYAAKEGVRLIFKLIYIFIFEFLIQ